MSDLSVSSRPAQQSEPAVPVAPASSITKILVPFDFSDPAIHALNFAKQLADRFGASLELLHVVADPRLAFMPVGPGEGVVYIIPPGLVENLVRDGEARLEKALSSADRRAYRAHTTVELGDPRTRIIAHAAAEHVNLIVMGTHGRSGTSHLLLGSVAERVVRTAPCPVLTVR